ncbi:uncharacterized protein LOC142326780 [Lycorma delicatula]|uniref:uncharacterized protein LOC142326780 n=1 Tax=Lycorma delicatula TaxID=130591 RepID=UPI003F51033C
MCDNTNCDILLRNDDEVEDLNNEEIVMTDEGANCTVPDLNEVCDLSPDEVNKILSELNEELPIITSGFESQENLDFAQPYLKLNLTKHEEAGKQPTPSTQDSKESVQINEPTTSTAQYTCTSPEEIPVQSVPKKPPARPPKRSYDKCDSVLERTEHLKKPNLKQDRYNLLGKSVALRMIDMSDDNQRLVAEKLINDTLFMGEMGQLTISQSICDSVNSVPTSENLKKPNLNQNRYDLLGKSVALRMIDMSDDNQRLVAEKLINDTLFMGEMGQLNISHSICDGTNHKLCFPVNESSDNSNQSLASYFSSFRDV